MNTNTLNWIKSTLVNAEDATDEELVSYFVSEGGLSNEEAQAWVDKRTFYRRNIVIQDDEGNDVSIWNPHTRLVEPL